MTSRSRECRFRARFFIRSGVARFDGAQRSPRANIPRFSKKREETIKRDLITVIISFNGETRAIIESIITSQLLSRLKRSGEREKISWPVNDDAHDDGAVGGVFFVRLAVKGHYFFPVWPPFCAITCGSLLSEEIVFCFCFQLAARFVSITLADGDASRCPRNNVRRRFEWLIGPEREAFKLFELNRLLVLMDSFN